MSGGTETRYGKICALPWKHLATHPHGGCTLCCISDQKGGVSRARNFREGSDEWLSLNNNTIHEIMNSDYYKKVRLQMLGGQEPDACKRCYDEERTGIRSKRSYENEIYFSNDLQERTAKDGSISLDFEFIELRLGNVCNFRCRTCNPASSTKWIRSHKILENKLSFVTKYGEVEKGTWYDSETFWDDLLLYSKNIKRIYINGGEPTLIKKHFYYLEKLIESGLNKNIELVYALNLTNVDDELLRYWKQFKKCRINASIDDLGEKNEYIRYHSKWDETISNLHKLKNETWIELSVCQTISLYNIENIVNFYKFVTVDEGLAIQLNWVYDPVFQQAWHLDEDKKKTIIAQCKEVMKEYDYEGVKTHLEQPQNKEQLENFIKYNTELDGLT